MNLYLERLIAAAIEFFQKLSEGVEPELCECPACYMPPVEEIPPEVLEYQEYINSQIFNDNLSDTENYWEQYESNEPLPGLTQEELDWHERVVDQDDEAPDFFSENVHIDDPRITDEQRDAIKQEIAQYGIDVDNVNFDISGDGISEDFYNFNPVMGDRIIFAVTPWGEVISSLFSEDNMKMAYEVSQIEAKPVDNVILEVMAERYNIANELE